MYVYDIVALLCIGISHFVLYFYLIRYDRITLPYMILLSIAFSILLGTIITVTGYPEFNTIVTGLFLMSLGLMQIELSFFQNVYFTIANMVSISLLKIMLFELAVYLYYLSPFNLYIWTENLLHMIVTIVILAAILLLKKQIARFAEFIVTSPFLYYVSYLVLVISLIIIFLLTMPQVNFLYRIYETYGEIMYTSTFILFFILLIIVMVGAHLTKEKLVQEQQEQLDDELLQYVNKLELLHDDLANFRHDYVNLLLTLDDGIRMKDMDQIERTYKDVIKPTLGIINNHELDIVKLANVQEVEIKSLLSVKVFEAQQVNIQVVIDIPHPIDSIPLALVDFIRIISVILDNAIEAAVESKEKLLHIAFLEKELEIYFVVRNSIADRKIDLGAIFEKDFSTKDSSRGYGLYSLKQLVDKTDNATLETAVDPPYFTQVLRLKRKNK